MNKRIILVLSMMSVCAISYADVGMQEEEVASQTVIADEQAFSAKLSDQNRHAFFDKLTSDQRGAVMTAVQNGASAEEAIAHMILAQSLKSSAVAEVQ